MGEMNWWDGYAAVIFDLDGTLLRLDVDWGQVASDVGDILEEAGLDPEEHDSWELLDAAGQVGLHDRASEIIAEHERAGARSADRLPLADVLAEIAVPVGVVSLNAESAVRLALERDGLIEDVDVVVGRDSVPERKPSPEPLLAAIEDLGVDPDEAIFVGDSDGDEETARRAGVDFRWV